MSYAASVGLTLTPRQEAAYNACSVIAEAGERFNEHRGPMGLLPDEVRTSPDYKEHLRKSRTAFMELRAANMAAKRAKAAK